MQALFLEARAVPAAARDAHLAAACADTPTLIDEVRRLLDADERIGVLDALGARLPALDDVLDDAPATIGAYRIVRELGRGGMGVVYLAERDDGQFQHRVAIKLIDTTDPGDPLHRRFLAERRILAGLQHPNIARLLDGGVTERGRPYLVMEYVDGVPITEYCDTHELGVRERLRLFGEVCAAVQHAHRNLVIHRDLKPGNILVTADGRVHLLDFGIAKLLEPGDTAPSQVTRIERVLTPGYASPEQVRGDTLTTASDIYALGTLLFELLAGSRPFDAHTDSTAGLLEAICQRDPGRPSARTGRWRRQIEGDLDSIVAMALRKEPHRRYASADLLREDVERHLNGFPVFAHRGSRRYRFDKFVRRHRAEFVAAVVVVVSLIAGMAAALTQARAAEHARIQAELALAQSQEIGDFLIDLFRTGESTEPADEVTALDLLARGAARADALRGQPAVQARLLDVLGQLTTHLGRYDDAERMLAQAADLHRARGDSLGLASSLIHLAHVHRARRDLQTAQPFAREAVDIRRSVLPPEHPDLARALYELGWVSYGEEQARHYGEALDILRASGADPDLRMELLHGLATNLRRRGRMAETVAIDREALAFAQAAFGPDHANTGYAMIHLADQVADLEDDTAEAERLYRTGLDLMRRQLGDADVALVHGMHGLGTLLSRRGDQAGAESLFRRTLDIRVAATGPEHPQAIENMRLLAEQLARSGHHDQALKLGTEALDLARRIRGPDHSTIAALFLPALARIHEANARFAEADSLYRQALAMAEGVDLMRDYGRFLIRRGAYTDAETRLLGLLALQESWENGESHPATTETKRALMELYTAWGRPGEVERFRVPPGRYIPY